MEEVDKAANGIHCKNFDAILTPADSLVSNGIDSIAKMAITERRPVVSSLLNLVKRGALASYAADYSVLGRQGAVLVDKILRGAHPVNLPIELPRKYTLAFNLRTTKAIDLKISKELLPRADEVIE